MLPVVFINCSRHPFLKKIMDFQKEYETRTRNMLGRFLGERVLFAETGHGKPVVRCSAVISEIIEVYTQEAWNKYLRAACIPAGSTYDWQPGTRKKVLYRLTDVVACDPFTPPEGIRHGRVWMEYEPRINHRVPVSSAGVLLNR